MEVAGLNICKAAFLMTDWTLSDKDKSMWRNVKLLILDKISFMGDDHLKKLDRRLKEMGDKQNLSTVFQKSLQENFANSSRVVCLRVNFFFTHVQ